MANIEHWIEWEFPKDFYGKISWAFPRRLSLKQLLRYEAQAYENHAF